MKIIGLFSSPILLFIANNNDTRGLEKIPGQFFYSGLVKLFKEQLHNTHGCL